MFNAMPSALDFRCQLQGPFVPLARSPSWEEVHIIPVGQGQGGGGVVLEGELSGSPRTLPFVLGMRVTCPTDPLPFTLTVSVSSVPVFNSITAASEDLGGVVARPPWSCALAVYMGTGEAPSGPGLEGSSPSSSQVLWPGFPGLNPLIPSTSDTSVGIGLDLRCLGPPPAQMKGVCLHSFSSSQWVPSQSVPGAFSAWRECP